MSHILSSSLPAARRWFAAGVLAVVCALAGLLVFQSSFVAAYSGCSAETAPVINADFEARVAELINQERARNGNLPPLKLVSALSAAARYHAADMGNDDYFNHDSMDRVGGSLKRVCGTFERISLWYKGWNGAAENIAAGYNSPEQVMESWMSSEGHRANILNPDYTEFGVGYFAGAGTFPSYWAQDFGVRGDVTPMVLAGEAATTTQRELDVYVRGQWNQIRLRNDSGAWSAWQPFTNSFTWTIGDGRGRHIVAAELRNGGTTRSTCDSIMLDIPAVAGAQIDGNSKLFLPALRNGIAPVCD